MNCKLSFQTKIPPVPNVVLWTQTKFFVLVVLFVLVGCLSFMLATHGVKLQVKMVLQKQ